MQEKDLIERSLTGDEEAFGQLVHAYQQKIFHHCLHLLKDEGSAHDLTQEAFVHAYRNLSSFRRESSFYTWVYRIAHNLCLNILRKKKHLEQEFKEEILLPQQILKEGMPKEEFHSALSTALEHLSPKQRIVFEMFDIQKLSIKEVAAQLQIPEGTVRSRLFYARRKIRTYLKEYRI